MNTAMAWPSRFSQSTLGRISMANAMIVLVLVTLLQLSLDVRATSAVDTQHIHPAAAINIAKRSADNDLTETAKRYASFRSDLGKKDQVETEHVDASDAYVDDEDRETAKRLYGFRADLGKRYGNYGFSRDLGKRYSGFRADLGKRFLPWKISDKREDLDNFFKRYYGFRSDLGKRAASYDDSDLDDEEDAKRYMGFRSDLGKRGEDKRFMFRGDLGKRYSGFRSDLGKRASYFRADLGKRLFSRDLGKRSLMDEQMPNEPEE